MRIVILFLSLVLPFHVSAQDNSDYDIMANAPGRDFVYLLCADCHSMQHVLEKRYTRSGWRQSLQRMTDEFGMAELSADERREVLNYLTTHYAPGSGN